MNNTNRALNRLFIFIIGLILVIVGLAVAAVNLIPVIRTGWEDTAPTVQQNVDGVYAASPMFATGNSWVGVGVIAVLVILVILLLVFIFKQGHGHTNRLIRDERTEHGVTVIDSGVAENVLEDALTGRPELVSVHVSTFDVKGTPTLNVSVTARRGVSPKDVATTVEKAVRGLDTVIGKEIPAYVRISGGFRARANSTTRLQ